ncbi:Proteinase inhibitor propeptide [Botryosphaeria dothidea]|uniref:Proteinase inhibitor propeptide n=1 Tax=Botryosphaeria dothidea TaxID=55169 RepID=A0A8H4N4E5_9PEZI|nr:Proteinase inhibitor propeptide [Botryosphaeria dothidea]
MPAINVTLKEGASADELEKAKKSVADQGGKVTHEFKLIKGFTYDYPTLLLQTASSSDRMGPHPTPHTPINSTLTPAEFPADTVHSLATNDHVTVEADQEVKTQ